MANPLDTVAQWTARNLGTYELNTDGTFGTVGVWANARAYNRADDSGLRYDGRRKQLLWGGSGGHGPGQQTNFPVWSLSTNAWTNLYSDGTPYAYLAKENVDWLGVAAGGNLLGAYNTASAWNGGVTGRWTGPNGPSSQWQPQPLATHTRGMCNVAYDAASGKDRFLVLQGDCFPDTVNNLGGTGDTTLWGGRMKWWDWVLNKWVWSSIDVHTYASTHVGGQPWSWTAGCCTDPVNNKVLIAGPNLGSTGSVYYYDWRNDPGYPNANPGGLITTLALSGGYNAVNSTGCEVVYFPTDSRGDNVFYWFRQIGASAPFNFTVSRIVVNRVANTAVVTLLAPTGTTPYSDRLFKVQGWNYDVDRNKIGGPINNGIFYEYDPTQGTDGAWLQQAISVEANIDNPPFGTTTTGDATHCQNIESSYMCNGYISVADGFGGYVFVFLPLAVGGGVPYRPRTFALRTSQPASPGVITVTLDFGLGDTATFTSNDATNSIDKGDYIGQFVRCKSYKCTEAAHPDWSVWFRFDADSNGRINAPNTGWRDEVMVELGTARSGTARHFGVMLIDVVTTTNPVTVSYTGIGSIQNGDTITLKAANYPNINNLVITVGNFAATATGGSFSCVGVNGTAWPAWTNNPASSGGSNFFGFAQFQAPRGYNVTIKKDNATLYSHTVNQHFWYSRWRWFQSATGDAGTAFMNAVRPIVRTPAALKALKWIPNFGTTGMFNAGAGAGTAGFGAPYVVTWPGPMGSVNRNITVGTGTYDDPPYNPNQGVGGDHPELGFLTEAAATYCVFGNSHANVLTTVYTDGEFTGNWAMHIRESDGSMPNFRTTSATDFWINAGSGSGNVRDLYYKQPNIATYTNWVTIQLNSSAQNPSNDGSHWYASALLPYLMTDDPFYLEAIQFGYNHRLLPATSRIVMGLGGIPYMQQTRSVAWMIRDAAILSAATPTVTPSWLRNAAHWQNCLNDLRTAADRFRTDPCAARATYREWTLLQLTSTFMHSWISAMCGFAAAIDPAWTTIFRWTVGREIALCGVDPNTGGASGWNRQWPCPYDPSAVKVNYWSYYNGIAPDFTDFYPPTYKTTADCVTSWADYWTWYKGGMLSNGVYYADTKANDTTVMFPLDDSGWDGVTLMHDRVNNPVHGYLTYLFHLRAAIVQAINLGVPFAQQAYNWLHPQITAKFANPPGEGTVHQWFGQARFSLDPSAAASRFPMAALPNFTNNLNNSAGNGDPV